MLMLCNVYIYMCVCVCKSIICPCGSDINPLIPTNWCTWVIWAKHNEVGQFFLLIRRLPDLNWGTPLTGMWRYLWRFDDTRRKLCKSNDATTVLSKGLASKGIYPAVDPLFIVNKDNKLIFYMINFRLLIYLKKELKKKKGSRSSRVSRVLYYIEFSKS